MNTPLAIFQGDKPVHFVARVNESAGTILTRAIEFSDLAFEFGAEEFFIKLISSGEHLEDIAKAYYIRDYYNYPNERHAVARYLANKDCRIYNSDLINTETISKLEQMTAFCAAGLPVPKTFFSRHPNYSRGFKQFPLIVKSIVSNSGNFNFLVKNQKELQDALRKTEGRALVQEYVENDGDYRVVIMYGEPAIAYKRLRSPDSKSHLNNVAQGSSRELIEDKAVIDLAVKAAKHLKREFCGIDIIKDKNSDKLLLLESNFSAGMHSLNDGIDTLYFENAASLIKNHNHYPSC